MERQLPDCELTGGRPRVLPLWRAVVLLCFLLRHNAVQEMAGELFSLSQPAVSRYGTLLRPVVRDSLKQLGFGIARLPRGEPVLVDHRRPRPVPPSGSARMARSARAPGISGSRVEDEQFQSLLPAEPIGSAPG
ncbi:hypothetical protein [Streptomyces sp. x-80]|uniref:hypothetical protein n=1 Tax=Streptomyces sp. x-80 TaxID=2789282 RepID=UPI00397ED805